MRLIMFRAFCHVGTIKAERVSNICIQWAPQYIGTPDWQCTKSTLKNKIIEIF